MSIPSPAPGHLLALLLDAAAQVFGRPVAAHDSFFELGGDSIAAVELATVAERLTGIEVDTELIVEQADFTALAAALTPASTAPEAAR
ncbi:acyl carrier protein [Kitasatospora acidiphila]|uniref:Acyl carrier protein n=1 Tax=Kitasatospora acidiphila TaxID=2567942 RepID=A0A540WG77_9ACTN|nr:acyl carrier protein [Kitasatospora acidiphila]TQF08026.1 acyl carrier protein [Kitasatospora acidiphila]